MGDSLLVLFRQNSNDVNSHYRTREVDYTRLGYFNLDRLTRQSEKIAAQVEVSYLSNRAGVSGQIFRLFGDAFRVPSAVADDRDAILVLGSRLVVLIHQHDNCGRY